MSGIDMSGMLVKKKNVRIDDDFRAMVVFEAASRIYCAHIGKHHITKLNPAYGETLRLNAVAEAVDLFNLSLKAFDKLD